MDTRQEFRRDNVDDYSRERKDISIPVIEEQVVISRDIVETGKVHIIKRVTEEDIPVDLPIIEEGYEVERKPVEKQLLSEAPGVRHEGENMIIPVIREVLVVQKRYEVIEEIHIKKTRTEIPNQQQVTVKKESIEVKRESTTR